jgi:hypothetical protein
MCFSSKKTNHRILYIQSSLTKKQSPLERGYNLKNLTISKKIHHLLLTIYIEHNNLPLCPSLSDDLFKREVFDHVEILCIKLSAHIQITSETILQLIFYECHY